MSASAASGGMRRVLSLRGFRLLTVAAATSLLGDQFALVAMPWLALQLTGDPLTLGAVLALEGVPRAVFMLLGGAVTDRLSPRAILILSDSARFVLTGALALLVFVGAMQVWMLYAFGLAFGLVAGFAVPAATSIVPTLVEEADLRAGNAVVMGVEQLVGFVGPSLAGLLIGAYAHSFVGIGLAFAIDAASFGVSAFCLVLIGAASRPLKDGHESPQGVLAAIGGGLRYLWQDGPMRLMLFVLMGVNFLLAGPMMVGVPVLADQRLAQGALAFGLLMSFYAGGNLLGYLAAGTLPRIGGSAMRTLMTALLTGFGLGFAALGFLTSTWVDAALLFVLGLGNGYVAITLFTWVQTRTPKAMLGRMMSIFMLTSVGLVPVSQAASGAVARWDLTLLFVLAGGLEFLLGLWATLRPELTAFSESLAAASGPGASAAAAAGAGSSSQAVAEAPPPGAASGVEP